MDIDQAKKIVAHGLWPYEKHERDEMLWELLCEKAESDEGD